MLGNDRPPVPMAEPLRRLLDPSQPLCREDVLWALDYMKRKAADGAPEWGELDRPQLLRYFACFAEMALLLLHRRAPGGPETACFRELLAAMQTNGAGARSESAEGRKPPVRGAD